MSKFTDHANREWDVQLDAVLIRSIREEMGLDLLNVETYCGPLADPVRFVEVLFALLAEPITSQGITPEDFAKGLGGDVFPDAMRSVWYALADFLPSSKGAVVRELIAKLEDATAAATAEAQAAVEDLDVSTLARAA